MTGTIVDGFDTDSPVRATSAAAASGGRALRAGYRFAQCGSGRVSSSGGDLSEVAEEASPSPVYGAALLMRFGFNAHPGFKSPSLRHARPWSGVTGETRLVRSVDLV